MKNHIKTFLKWLYGVLFVITGLIFFKYSFLSGLTILLAGLILLPPTLKLLESRIQTTLSRGTKYASVIILFFVGVIAFSNSNFEKEEQEKIEEEERFSKLPKEEQEKILAERAREDSLRAVQAALIKEKEKESQREELIQRQFNAWDGSHRGLTKYIKEQMNDPDSYEHVKTSYWDLKDHLVVLTQFRGRNAFGGKITNSVKAKVDMEGNLIEIIEQF